LLGDVVGVSRPILSNLLGVNFGLMKVQHACEAVEVPRVCTYVYRMLFIFELFFTVFIVAVSLFSDIA
jgi:hypothetical protein